MLDLPRARGHDRARDLRRIDHEDSEAGQQDEGDQRRHPGCDLEPAGAGRRIQHEARSSMDPQSDESGRDRGDQSRGEPRAGHSRARCKTKDSGGDSQGPSEEGAQPSAPFS